MDLASSPGRSSFGSFTGSRLDCDRDFVNASASKVRYKYKNQPGQDPGAHKLSQRCFEKWERVGLIRNFVGSCHPKRHLHSSLLKGYERAVLQGEERAILLHQTDRGTSL